MKTQWLLIGAVVLNLIFSTTSDILAKYWGITDNLKYLFLGLAVNALTVFFYMAAIKYGTLAITMPIVLIITIIISVGVGHFFFHESMNLTQWVGIAVGIVAVALISGIVRPA